MLDDIPRPGLWKRLLIGAFLVIFAAAGATAVAAFHEIDKVVDALELNPELKLGKNALAVTDPGEPQTLLILGSDRRPKTNGEGASGARSDTIMLVRLNPHKEATAIMSLPRDLKVRIPGYGVDKINASYEFGGPALTLRTVQDLTGLPINHVINVTFKGFWRAVNAIGCVYADVDRDYYNDSAEYTFIDINQGYQRLCARKALQYVRFRHTDDDLVRSARQQDFLRQLKQQVTYTKLIQNKDRLTKIFGRNTATDERLRSRSEVLRLLKLAVFSAGQPIQEIHFEGEIGPSFVEASNAQVKNLVQRFLDVKESAGPRGVAPGERPAKKPRKKQKRSASSLDLYDASVTGEDQGLQAVQQGAGGSLPVLYPTLLLNSSQFAYGPRVYKLRDTDGNKHGAYRMVMRRTNANGEYYGLQGTTWKDPPILDAPSEKRTVGGREYELHFAGDRLRLVAWRTSKAAYWVSNTLLQTLTKRQMMAIARSARRCC
ncbi:MAG: polyisoprenyl-teichoic acid--peptidoglycan teichoic acid transferase [Thermoleophilaceae bacterium]|jgi:LCP family protein required for cell wall assembly|nr:polyisoprenyl-teichoic acid--peptidoglycan teichoic acid transferase [Thermoleophilaceae bacterium]